MNLKNFRQPMFLLLIPLAVLLTSCAFGTVRDAQTGAPIPGAKVTFLDSHGVRGTTTTNENGVYIFDESRGDKVPAKGPVTFQVSAPGYNPLNEPRNVQYDDNSQGTWEAQGFELWPTSTSCIPNKDLLLNDIAVKLGGYGDMVLSNIKDSDTFTMTVGNDGDNERWASVGVDLLDFWDWGKKPGRDLSCYKYLVIRAKGTVGGEEFRIGLGLGPVDYLYDRGLTTQWQDIAFDMGKIWSLKARSDAYQFGFEIGQDWTSNTYGTTIYIDGVTFTNQLPPSSIAAPMPTPTP